MPAAKTSPRPSLRLVRHLLKSYPAVLAVDEVGRGPAAGPCTVGVVLCLPALPAPPAGLADSKALTPIRRRNLIEPIRAWAPTAVAHATAAEVDEWGISLALTLAFRRALGLLPPHPTALVLLDGSYDWANPKPQLLLPPELCAAPPLAVRTLIRGDASCVAISAASVLAKETRDELMIGLDAKYPGYDLAANKGYLSPAHVKGLKTLGFSPCHRRSWSYERVLG
jgi:ribonuclease HII